MTDHATGLTKQGVVDYYMAVAETLLPHLRDRVVTRIRYPDGTDGERFFERHAPARMPEWIRAVTVSASPGTGKAAKRVRYPVIDHLAALAWMANQAALEPESRREVDSDPLYLAWRTQSHGCRSPHLGRDRRRPRPACAPRGAGPACSARRPPAHALTARIGRWSGSA